MKYDELKELDLSSVGSTMAFCWIWVGDGTRNKGGGGVGLEEGRELLKGWGYR